MRLLLAFTLLLFSLIASAQLETRYVMAASFSGTTSPTSTTHATTLNVQSDQLGQGYLANQVQVGWRVLTSTYQQYEITTVNTTTFSTADVVLTEIGATTTAPSGVAVVYQYGGATEVIPPLPANATGVSQALLAAISLHNFEVLATASGGVSSWNDLTDRPADLVDGDDVNDADADPVNEDNRLGLSGNTLTIYKADGVTPINNVTLGGGLIYSYDCAPVGSLSELCVHVARVGAATITMGGSAATGFTVDADGVVKKLIITGDSADANASGEFVLTITQPESSLGTQFYSYELYDLTNNQKVDVHLTGNVAAQTFTDTGADSDVVFTIPNISGNYPNGFRLVLN